MNHISSHLLSLKNPTLSRTTLVDQCSKLMSDYLGFDIPKNSLRIFGTSLRVSGSSSLKTIVNLRKAELLPLIQKYFGTSITKID